MLPRNLLLPLLALLALAAAHCRSAANHDRLAPDGPGPAVPSAPAEPPRPTSTTSAAPTPPPPGPASAAPAWSALPSLAEPPALLPAPPTARRVFVIGDSLSDFRVGGGGYLRALERACPTLTIENRARGGWMVNQMRRRMETEVTPAELARFTDAIVFGGVNDVYSDRTAGRNFDKITSDLSVLYRIAKSARLRVIAITISPWGGFLRYYTPARGRTTERINAWIEEQRRSRLVDVVIDANALLSCGDPERLCPAYAHPINDGLHFGAKGHERLGAALIEGAFADCAAPK